MWAMATWFQDELLDMSVSGIASWRPSVAAAVEAVGVEISDRYSELNCQGIANLVWAIARLDVQDGFPVGTLAEAAVVNISAFKEQGQELAIATVAWSLAYLQDKNAGELLSEIEKQLAQRKYAATDFGPTELCNLIWCYGALSQPGNGIVNTLLQPRAATMAAALDGQQLASIVWTSAKLLHQDGDFLDKAERELVKKLSNMSVADVARLLWSLAMLDTKHERSQLHDHVLQRLDECLDTLDTEFLASRYRPEECVVALRSAVWTLWSQGRLSTALHRRVEDVFSRLGLVLDTTQANGTCTTVPSLAPGVAVLPALPLRSDEPIIVSDCPSATVVQKPAGWEVDQDEYAADDRYSLSEYVQALLPKRMFGLSRDKRFNRGFLHRLDVPTSGLIIVPKDYNAYFEFQLQLNTGRMCRDYIAACHGAPFHEATGEMDEHVVHAPLRCTSSGSRTQVDRQMGQPATTRYQVVARGAHASTGMVFSLLALRIVTGRQHQIRVHTAHIGHPTSCDNRYTTTRTSAADVTWCKRNFLHRYRLEFETKGCSQPLREVLCPLPSDLRSALRLLVPIGRGSQTEFRRWLCGSCLSRQVQWRT
eukprot:TRINITY_DN22879_c0_g1_i3.p1 TRINITY_DN22879_c0_g1~~TRINITY_DN22879_c0_g1_i3.p1  ORF type:complete len:594 (-),score=44.09 TRINITY_DN22879_c0_g1_i3:843-2624(-)